MTIVVLPAPLAPISAVVLPAGIESDAAQHRAVALRIGEVDILEINGALKVAKYRAAPFGIDFVSGFHHRADRLELRVDLRQVEEVALQFADMGLQAIEQHHGPHGDGKADAPPVHAAHDQAQDRQITHLRRGCEPGGHPFLLHRRQSGALRSITEPGVMVAFLTISADRPHPLKRHQHMRAQFAMDGPHLNAKRTGVARKAAGRKRDGARSTIAIRVIFHERNSSVPVNTRMEQPLIISRVQLE